MAAAAVTELLKPIDGGLTKRIWQRHKLLNMLRKRLDHGHHWVRLGTAPSGAGEQEWC